MLPAAEDAPKGHTTLGNQPRAEPDSAFRSMYAEHRPALLRLATTLTAGDRGRAEDLVQETMLRAWTHRNDLDIHRSPRAWLATTTRHLAIDAHRARIPAGTVKSRIFYGLRALRRTLAAQDAVASAKGIVTG